MLVYEWTGELQVLPIEEARKEVESVTSVLQGRNWFQWKVYIAFYLLMLSFALGMFVRIGGVISGVAISTYLWTCSRQDLPGVARSLVKELVVRINALFGLILSCLHCHSSIQFKQVGWMSTFCKYWNRITE